MPKLIRILFVIIFVSHGNAYAADLLEIYRLAQESDPQLKATEQARLAVMEGKQQSEALRYPTVSFNTDFNFNRQHITVPQIGETYFTSRDYTLNLNQPVYHRDTDIQLHQADARIAQADATVAATEQNLITRVATLYFDVLAAQDNLGFAQAEKKAIARQLEQSQQRFDVGLVAITDVQEAQARYDSSVAQEIAAERQLASSLEALREVTGQQHKNLSVLQAEIPLATPQPADVEQWTTTALKQNLLLSAAQYGVEVAHEEIERQRSGHYPILDIVANHNFSKSGGGRFGVFEADTDVIGLQLKAPIYQGGLVTSKMREAEFRHNEAREKLDQQQRSILRQTRDSYIGVSANISQVKALKQAVASNQTALEATEAGLEVGTRTEVDVLNAQRELFRARRDYARARYDYILETLRLKQAAGTLSPVDLEQINSWLK